MRAITRKIKQEAEQAAAPNQGAAAFFYSTETEHFCRGDGQCAVAKTVEEYLLLPNKKNLFKSLAKHPFTLSRYCRRIVSRLIAFTSDTSMPDS